MPWAANPARRASSPARWLLGRANVDWMARPAAEVLGIDRRTLNRMFARERAAAAGREMTEEELAAMEREDDEHA